MGATDNKRSNVRKLGRFTQTALRGDIYSSAAPSDGRQA
jgi:hypothetical protein